MRTVFFLAVAALLCVLPAHPAYPSDSPLPGGARVSERVFGLPGLDNVGRIAPGIYRGAEPEEEGYATLRRMGIRTVVNLRSTHSEREEVEAEGMASVEIPMNIFRDVDRETVRKAVSVISDPARQPVYLHCKLGQDRTGVVAAVYRMEAEGWSLQEAEEEMQAFGFNDIWVHLLAFLHEYALSLEKETRELMARIGRDMDAVSLSREGLRGAVEFAASRPGLFSGKREDRLLTRQEKMTLWSTWSIVLDHMASLDRFRDAHGDYRRIRDSEARRASFMAAYGAFLAQYRYALQFLSLVGDDPAVDTVLNEEVPELGLPGGTYYDFRYRFLNIAKAADFAALRLMDRSMGRDDAGPFRRAMEDDAGVIWKMGRGEGVEMTLENAMDIVRKAGFSAWMPVQEGVSRLMGDVRVRRWGSSLITEEQARSLPARLEPGDILLERREWYLSNLGLPGFWTHAALYIGIAAERKAYFGGGDVKEWVRAKGAADGDFEGLLRRAYPGAYEKSLSAQDGDLPRVLEAVAEGVIFSTLEHSAAADSIAVLRPRLSKKDKAAAIFRAFHYSGRPYDFNFDFLTDSALVCSELVYKAYEPAPGFRGLGLPVEEMMGRKIATPNGIARQFDAQYGTGAQQADLVVFLDGNEKADAAFEAPVEEFRRSWRRPKWHILFTDAPGAAKK